MTTWLYWDGPRAMNPALELCAESIRRHNPDARLLDDAAVAELGGESILAQVSHRKPWEKADVIRLWLLHRFGGQWIDCDCVCLRRLDWQEAYLDRYDLVGFGYKSGSPYFSNAVLAAPQGSPLAADALERALNVIRRAGDGGIPYGATGQVALRGQFRAGAKICRHEHWRLMRIPWTRAGRFARESNDGWHARQEDWNPDAWLYHLTGKGLSWFARRSRGELLSGRSFFSFLLRKSLEQQP